MSDMDYVEVLARVYEWNGIWDTSGARAYATCEWLKNNTDTWTKWIPDIEEYSYDCNDYTDDNLQVLVTEYYSGDTQFASLDIQEYSEFVDRTIALKIFENCASGVNSTQDGGIIFTRILSFISIIVMVIYAMLVLSYRKKHSLIRAASWKLTLTMIVGSGIGLAYPWLALAYDEDNMKFLDDSSASNMDHSNFLNCYMRPYVMHISLFTVMGALTLKTWRLVRIHIFSHRWTTFLLCVFSLGGGGILSGCVVNLSRLSLVCLICLSVCLWLGENMVTVIKTKNVYTTR